VQQDIGVTVPVQSRVVRDVHATQMQRSPGNQSMRIMPHANPVRDRC
jgi:hypothetical protein